MIGKDSDLPKQRLTFSLDAASLKLGVGIDERLGLIEYSPVEMAVLAHFEVVVTVTDSTSRSAVITFWIKVIDVNHNPEIKPIGQVLGPERSLFKFDVVAKDTDLPKQTLKFFTSLRHG